MSMVEQYVRSRILNKKYVSPTNNLPIENYQHRRGWVDIPVGNEMIYSHRTTYFTKSTFSEGLHVHEHYEMHVYMRGDVDYISENTIVKPSEFSVVWFNPGVMHTTRLLKACEYDRYVFYFTPDFFEFNGERTPMLDFMNRSDSYIVKIPESMRESISAVLEKADKICTFDVPYATLLLKAYLLELFGILNTAKLKQEPVNEFVETMAMVKRYIDKEYANIVSISDVASKFFYSREHLSRKFNQAFNITIAAYISKRRIMESLTLLPTMSVADSAYAVGFRSQSAYIAAFEKNMGCLPSEYKARHK